MFIGLLANKLDLQLSKCFELITESLILLYIVGYKYHLRYYNSYDKYIGRFTIHV